MKKVLFVATVVKIHIIAFHIPFLKWFKDNGYEVHVAARNDYKHKNDCRIPYCDTYYDLPFERSPLKNNNLKVLQELSTIINDNEFDIVHCHTPMGGVIGRLAASNSRKKGTKVIYTAHGFHFFKGAPLLNWLIFYPIERILANITDTLITINHEDFSRAKKFNAKNIEYIPGVGVNLERYHPSNCDLKKKRQSIGLKNNEFMIISVGELNKNKNHKIIIEALFKAKDSSIKYVICGIGPSEVELKKLVDQLGISNQVIFLGFRSDILELNQVADVFVFPSFREGLSLSLMEAMASGLPVICSNIRGNSDLIKNNKGGFLINPKDSNEIAKYLLYLKKDSDFRKTASVYNRIIIEKFSLTNVIKEMAIIYKDYSG